MRKKIIIGNWKMNMTREEAKKLLTGIKLSVKNINSDVVFAVPFTDIDIAKEVLKGTKMQVGAQNMHYSDYGPYTGEISAEMLKELGIKYVILGHSERRENFFETDEVVNKKAKQALKNDIVPVICVGETIKEREQGTHLDKVRTQVKKVIADIDIKDIENVIIAYEPIWAISTSSTLVTESAEKKRNEAKEMCEYIRYVIAETYGITISEKVRIIYGGSVNPENASEMLNMESVDGALVGGASLKPTFSEVIGSIKE